MGIDDVDADAVIVIIRRAERDQLDALKGIDRRRGDLSYAEHAELRARKTFDYGILYVHIDELDAYELFGIVIVDGIGYLDCDYIVELAIEVVGIVAVGERIRVVYERAVYMIARIGDLLTAGADALDGTVGHGVAERREYYRVGIILVAVERGRRVVRGRLFFVVVERQRKARRRVEVCRFGRRYSDGYGEPYTVVADIAGVDDANHDIQVALAVVDARGAAVLVLRRRSAGEHEIAAYVVAVRYTRLRRGGRALHRERARLEARRHFAFARLPRVCFYIGVVIERVAREQAACKRDKRVLAVDCDIFVSGDLDTVGSCKCIRRR